MKTVIIIGAGPGGLQLAYYLEQNNIDYLVLDRGKRAGNFFSKFPIHKKLISTNKINTGFSDPEENLRYDWNSLLSDDYGVLFKDFSKEYFPHSDSFLDYMAKFSEKYKLKIEFNTEVSKISKSGCFNITTNHKTYKCEHLVVATGVSKPYIPKIKGIEHCPNYADLDLDFEKFTQKRVLIIGKSNSAFETADSLIPYASLIHCASPNPLKMAWATHFVGNVRAVNNNFLDTYQLKSQNGIINGNVEEIELKENKYFVKFAYANANGEVEIKKYDEVIVCTGFRFDASIFDSTIKPSLGINDKFPLQKSNWESINVGNLYFAGTITQVRDYKKSTSGFIHGFRYNSLCLFHILNAKIKGVEWKSTILKALPIENLASEILTFVNRSSSIWQQFGFIGNALIFDEEKETCRYIHDIPVRYLHDNSNKFGERYFIITLEYGDEFFKNAKCVFNVERIHKNDTKNAHLSPGLHPIIREYHKGHLVSTLHLIEDFEAKWNDKERHHLPLVEYLTQVLPNWSKNKSLSEVLN